MSDLEIKGFNCIDELMSAVRNEWPISEVSTNYYLAYLGYSYMDITIIDAGDDKCLFPKKKKYALNVKTFNEGNRLKEILPGLFPGIYIYDRRQK